MSKRYSDDFSSELVPLIPFQLFKTCSLQPFFTYPVLSCHTSNSPHILLARIFSRSWWWLHLTTSTATTQLWITLGLQWGYMVCFCSSPLRICSQHKSQMSVKWCQCSTWNPTVCPRFTQSRIQSLYNGFHDLIWTGPHCFSHSTSYFAHHACYSSHNSASSLLLKHFRYIPTLRLGTYC